MMDLMPVALLQSVMAVFSSRWTPNDPGGRDTKVWTRSEISM